MNTEKDTSIPCVVTQTNTCCAGLEKRAQSISPKLKMCEIVESARKFMALGLTKEQIKELDINEPVLQAICEHARLEDNLEVKAVPTHTPDESLAAINKEIQEVDLDLEMLKIRKQALKRRAKALQRQSDPGNHMED